MKKPAVRYTEVIILFQRRCPIMSLLRSEFLGADYIERRKKIVKKLSVCIKNFENMKIVGVLPVWLLFSELFLSHWRINGITAINTGSGFWLGAHAR